ncbi:MAG: L,D-transpeptidase [Gaiellaceae bacterium]
MNRGFAAVSLGSCAVGGLLSALVLAATPAAIADTGTSGTQTTGTTGTIPTTTVTTTTPPPTTTTAPTTTVRTTTAPPVPPPPKPPPPRPPRLTTIPAGVTIGGLLVGGLSATRATTEVRAFFARPVTIRIAGTSKLLVSPKALGAAAFVGDAVKRARISRPGAKVPLKVAAPRASIERYVERLARRFDRARIDSRLLLRGSEPFVTAARPGRTLSRETLSRELYRSVKTHKRGPLTARLLEQAPATTRNSIGDVIVIRRGLNKLSLYDGMTLRRSFGVATGQSRYPTPLGNFQIVVKWRNPWWYPPSSDWAKDAKPIPPGPGNPLGTRWLGISSPAVGIHGTPDAASIGYSASHGCIRMLIPEVEWLFEQVETGTPVFIVP